VFDTEIVCEPGSATGRKYVSGSEPFALGHYAGDPIYPGMLTLELMLQLADRLLLSEAGRQPGRTLIARAQYLDMVKPGDELEINAAVRKRTERRLQIYVRVSVAGIPKTRATIEYEL